MSRFGDWNQKNRELLHQSQQIGENIYREKYLEAVKKQRMEKLYTQEELDNQIAKAKKEERERIKDFIDGKPMKVTFYKNNVKK